ncbi:MAG: AAA family ATPase [Firmicutes bacterium]|nr:AAA family ATPase [Bacillota bacterium]MCL5040338.1 AAA family ATPase [Bacillota bacterium]
MDLFDLARQDELKRKAPLALRMAPRTLEEFVGQEAILGPGKLLRRAIEADQLSSLILYGPTGSGKTALARIIAGTTQSHFETLNAVTAGVADVRRVIQEARDRLGLYRKKTILFIDEIHRFNKAQQDALLPHVEDGTIILIGATTENPYFEVNPALVSRSRVFRLEALSDAEVRQILERALREERGLGGLAIQVDAAAADHLVRIAGGDARSALNALELAALTTPPGEDGIRHITQDIAAESIQRRALAYDREGDQHYDTISAYIKSLRGSDPDAALYWLARMLYAGEDPAFVARRLVICAAEDVGMADPQALVVAMAAASALELIGLPEGRIPLAEATVYVATAPKSNASYAAIHQALKDVEEKRISGVPLHLRDASYKGAATLGHGKGYKYAHDYPGNYVEQQYLPDDWPTGRYYRPTDNGYEKVVKERLAGWRGQRKER